VETALEILRMLLWFIFGTLALDTLYRSVRLITAKEQADV